MSSPTDGWPLEVLRRELHELDAANAQSAHGESLDSRPDPFEAGVTCLLLQDHTIVGGEIHDEVDAFLGAELRVPRALRQAIARGASRAADQLAPEWPDGMIDDLLASMNDVLSDPLASPASRMHINELRATVEKISSGGTPPSQISPSALLNLERLFAVDPEDFIRAAWSARSGAREALAIQGANDRAEDAQWRELLKQTKSTLPRKGGADTFLSDWQEGQ